MPEAESNGAGAPGGITGRAMAVAGLAGLAITQPVLDLFGRNPEFFVAGGYSTSQLVSFALVVALVPSAVGAVVLVAAARLDERLGLVVYEVGLGILAALFVFGSLRLAGVDSWVIFALVGAVGGVILVVAEARVAPVRLFLRYLALSNLLFLMSFLALSPSARLLRDPAFDPGRVEVPEPPGPVVVVVLDELPVTTLMDSEGDIDASRYPGFAELASRTSWFRNASSLSQATPTAVPQLLSGLVGEPDDLPTALDHSRNIMSLLGEDMRILRYEVATDLCPDAICDPLPRQPLSRALEDAAVVYGHRVLPSSFRSGLPPIDHSWGQFGAVAAAAPDEQEVRTGYDVLNSRDRSERGAGSQLGILRERLEAVGPEPALHLVHVLSPHYPWLVTPWLSENVDLPPLIDDEDDPAYDWSALQRYQAHAMQVGAVDTVIRDLVDHLDEAGIWPDTTLVVVADHGTSLLPPDFGRDVTNRNAEEVYRIPMFIKGPGARPGQVRDDVALSIDVLPTLVDMLGIETDWDFDGHSLFDGSRSAVDPLVDRSVSAALAVARQHAGDFPRPGWLGLAAIGDHADLVGTDVTEHGVGGRSALEVTLDRQEMLADIVPRSFAPQFLAGRVMSSDRPPELVVALDGVIAAVTGGYVRDGDDWRFVAMLGLPLQEGVNTIEVFEVDPSGGPDLLHPLG